MKVYAVRTDNPDCTWYTNYFPVQGWFTGVNPAKQWVRQHFNRLTPIEIVEYEFTCKGTLKDWIALLNGDTRSASDELEYKVPSDYTRFVKVVFRNAAMKRLHEERKKCT